MAEFMVEGYKTPYKSITKARMAAYRLFQQKKGRKDIKILEKIAPHVYSEIAEVSAHPNKVGATGYYCTEKGIWMYLDKSGRLFLRW